MDLETLQKIVGMVGMPAAVLIAGWYILIKERTKNDAEKERIRAEVQRERDAVAAELAAERVRHKEEIERMNQVHRVELNGWQQMAIQNNVIAMRNATNVDRATDIAEKVVEKVAPASQQTPP